MRYDKFMTLSLMTLSLMTLSLMAFILSCSFTSEKMNNFAKNIIVKYPVQSVVLIHQDPKIGDFAILKDASNNFKITYEVMDISNDLLHVKLLIKQKPSGPSCQFISFREYFYELIIDRNGKVQKALLVDPVTKEKTGIKINKSKESGIIKGKFEDNFILKTDTGNYKSKLFWSFDKKNKTYHVAFLSNDVYFVVVKLMTMNEIEFEQFRKLSNTDKSLYKTNDSLVLFKQGNRKK